MFYGIKLYGLIYTINQIHKHVITVNYSHYTDFCSSANYRLYYSICIIFLLVIRTETKAI